MYLTTLKMDQEKSRISYGRMISFGIVLVMPTFLSAFNQAYPAVALPQMKLDINAASWFASVSMFASPLSVIIIGFLIDRYGRKVALLYCIAPSIGGWLLLWWNYNVPLILLGQALNGLTINAGFYPVQVYAGECIMVDNIRMRNIFMTWISLSTSFGAFLTLIMGNIVSYQLMCLISSIMSISMLVIFFVVVPESPVWLHLKGRTGDAEWSQKRLMGITKPIFSSSVKEQSQQPVVQDKNSFLQKLKKLTRPDVYKPTIILSLAAMLLSWCGTTTVTVYLINIIQNTIPGVTSQIPQNANQTRSDLISQILDSKDELRLSYRLSLYSGLFMCVGSLVSIFVFPWLGLKKMLIMSKFFILLSMLTMTYGSVVEPENNILTRMAGVTIVMFLLGLEVGPRMSFAGDVFPVDAKGFASVPALLGSTAIATCNKVFPYLRVEFGGYAYCFFAVMCLFGVLYIHFLVPEVVGRSLEEINNEYTDDEKK